MRGGVMNWKPIETAPKDRDIVLWVPERGPDIGRWDMQPFHKLPKPYWVASGSERMFGVAWMRAHQPTHWCEITQPTEQRPPIDYEQACRELISAHRLDAADYYEGKTAHATYARMAAKLRQIVEGE
jgi:hypothetical protein